LTGNKKEKGSPLDVNLLTFNSVKTCFNMQVILKFIDYNLTGNKKGKKTTFRYLCLMHLYPDGVY